jgi:hypothetical protein
LQTQRVTLFFELSGNTSATFTEVQYCSRTESAKDTGAVLRSRDLHPVGWKDALPCHSGPDSDNDWVGLRPDRPKTSHTKTNRKEDQGHHYHPVVYNEREDTRASFWPTTAPRAYASRVTPSSRARQRGSRPASNLRMLMDFLELGFSRLMADAASLRNAARLLVQQPVRDRLVSSPNVTSNIQCKEFSMP